MIKEVDIKPILNKYAQRIMQRLIERYNELGLRASGAYEEQMHAVITDEMMTIFAPYHSYHMEKGRQPGKRPPVNVILKWMDEKRGVTFPSEEKKRRSVAFLIARKIGEKGIQVPNEYNKGEVISKVINDFMANEVNQMLGEIAPLFGREIFTSMIQDLKIAA